MAYASGYGFLFFFFFLGIGTDNDKRANHMDWTFLWMLDGLE